MTVRRAQRASAPTGSFTVAFVQKSDRARAGVEGLAYRLGRCFCILPYAEVSTGDPHPAPTGVGNDLSVVPWGGHQTSAGRRVGDPYNLRISVKLQKIERYCGRTQFAPTYRKVNRTPA